MGLNGEGRTMIAPYNALTPSERARTLDAEDALLKASLRRAPGAGIASVP